MSQIFFDQLEQVWRVFFVTLLLLFLSEKIPYHYIANRAIQSGYEICKNSEFVFSSKYVVSRSNTRIQFASYGKFTLKINDRNLAKLLKILKNLTCSFFRGTNVHLKNFDLLICFWSVENSSLRQIVDKDLNKRLNEPLNDYNLSIARFFTSFGFKDDVGDHP